MRDNAWLCTYASLDHKERLVCLLIIKEVRTKIIRMWARAGVFSLISKCKFDIFDGRMNPEYLRLNDMNSPRSNRGNSKEVGNKADKKTLGRAAELQYQDQFFSLKVGLSSEVSFDHIDYQFCLPSILSAWGEGALTCQITNDHPSHHSIVRAGRHNSWCADLNYRRGTHSDQEKASVQRMNGDKIKEEIRMKEGR